MHDGLAQRELAGDAGHAQRLVAAGEQEQDVGHAVGGLRASSGLGLSSTAASSMTALWHTHDGNVSLSGPNLTEILGQRA